LHPSKGNKVTIVNNFYQVVIKTVGLLCCILKYSDTFTKLITKTFEMGLISFVGFTLLVAFIAWWSTRKTDEGTSDGYFLGGRSLTAGVIAGSLLLTNLSTEQIVGLNGQAYTEGILVMAWETLAAIAIVLTALFLLPRYLKGGLTTVPQFLEKRFDRFTKTLTSGLFLSGYVVVLLPIVLYSGALAINTMFDIPKLLNVSDTAALWIMVWAIGIVGSIYAIFGGLKAVAVSEKFDSIGDSHASVPFATIFTGMMLVQLFYWGTNQAIIQRALAAKNLKEGQKGLMLAAFIKILGPIIVVLPGIIAFHMFGNLDNPDQAYPTLVNAVLPKVWLGFFAAVLFGAILSSFNSALNSSVTLFGIDIYKEYFNKEASEMRVVKAGKLFGVLLALLSMFIAPLIANAPQGLFGYLQEVNGCYNIPILTIIVVGYLTKRVPAIAAKVALFSGVILYSVSQFILKPFVFGNDNYPHFLHVMAILFVVNVLIMLIIGKLYPNDAPYEQVYTKQVNIEPWKHVKLVGIGILVIVIGVYIYFS
jgi:SSS family solute:Na+ symporter